MENINGYQSVEEKNKWKQKEAEQDAYEIGQSTIFSLALSDILIQLEIRCASSILENIYKISNLNQAVVLEARGFFGGIWVIQNSDKVQLELLAGFNQLVSVLIQRGEEYRGFSQPSTPHRHQS